MKYFAAAEVDQIQSVIFASDKLKEMIGASHLIDRTMEIVKGVVQGQNGIQLLWNVSGVYKLGGDDLNDLSDALWEIRKRLVDEQGLSVTFEILEARSGTSVTDIFRELDEGIRQQKDSRHGEDGTPSAPYFAPCRILSDEYAQHWKPLWDGNDRLNRRALVSEKAWIRKGAEDDNRGLPYVGEVLPDNKIKLPEDFDDLTVKGANDSYIAFIKGDGDGLGLLLGKINWDDSKWESADCVVPALLRPLEFSRSVQKIFLDSLKEAIVETASPDMAGKRFPVIPLLVGGEDLWLLSRRDLAFPLIQRIGVLFAEKAKADPFLKIALMVSGVDRLTLSFGVLFAQKGYPFDQQTTLVNELLKNAKAYRKKLPSNEQQGCVDFLWLDASGRETVAEMRRTAYGYKDNDRTFRLFSHPWTLEELQACREALAPFAGISRRKLYQWRDILRSGDRISVARAHRWLTSLEKSERQAWEEGVTLLPERLQPRGLNMRNANDLDHGFWRQDQDERVSVVQDLLELMEIGQHPQTEQTGV
jgi:hypothetical protein